MLCLQWLLACSALPALAADAPDTQAAKAERARIVAERRALLARFAAEEQACRERFIVTACIDDLHLRRRLALAPLRERELQLDDAERRQRAALRKSELAARQQAASQAGPETKPPAPELRVRKPSALASASASAPPSASAPASTSAPASAADSAAARAARHQSDSAARAADAAERAQDARQRAAAAQATQDRIAQRQAERQAKGKTAAPLPVPAASGPAGRPARVDAASAPPRR